MANNKIICPFCGKDITSNYRIYQTILQEETAHRDFSIDRTWTGSYLKETKYIRKFRVLCCKDCYDEYVKYNAITNKMSSFAIPIGFVAGIVFQVYTLFFKKDLDFSFGRLGACILGGVIGFLVCSIPTIIVNLTHSKKVSYKRAKECNASLD